MKMFWFTTIHGPMSMSLILVVNAVTPPPPTDIKLGSPEQLSFT